MPTDYIHTVSVDLASHEDAIALRDLIQELGYEAQLTYRSLNANARSPMRDTRLGILVLEAMTPAPGQKAKSFTADDLMPILEEHHFAPRSAAVALSMLTLEGDVIRIARGVYRIIE